MKLSPVNDRQAAVPVYPLLGRHVGRHVAVTVQMVLCHVQDRGRLEAMDRQPLELEAGKLEHIDIRRLRQQIEREQAELRQRVKFEVRAEKPNDTSGESQGK